MSERCELSDLLVDECGCRIHKPDVPEPVRRGYAFEAKFTGWCIECKEAIEIGEDICMHVRGVYVHAECVS